MSPWNPMFSQYFVILLRIFIDRLPSYFRLPNYFFFWRKKKKKKGMLKWSSSPLLSIQWGGEQFYSRTAFNAHSSKCDSE